MNSQIYERVLGEHGDRLLLYARNWCRSRSDAEDILQEACMRWLDARPNHVRDPLGYLFACVRTAALDWIKAGERRQRRELIVGGASEARFACSLQGEERRLTVEAALECLPPDQREVVVLHVWGERTFDDIARIVGVSINTVMSRWRYACDKLRGALTEENVA